MTLEATLSGSGTLSGSLTGVSSVWPTLVSALAADFVTAGVVNTTGQVYAGRRPQHVTDQRGEVWLERLPGETSGSLQHVTSCPVRMHYRAGRGNGGGNKAGTSQLTEVEAKLVLIRDRYRASMRFVATAGLEGSLPASAAEIQIDEDPEDEAVASGYVDVTFRLKE